MSVINKKRERDGLMKEISPTGGRSEPGLHISGEEYGHKLNDTRRHYREFDDACPFISGSEVRSLVNRKYLRCGFFLRSFIQITQCNRPRFRQTIIHNSSHKHTHTQMTTQTALGAIFVFQQSVALAGVRDGIIIYSCFPFIRLFLGGSLVD